MLRWDFLLTTPYFCYPFNAMTVPDSLFDVLMFGLLAAAVLLDFFFPNVFHGVATALVVAALSYSAAQDLAFALAKRGTWSQESLATSVALCALGFLFYFWRNDADVILVVLSIGLMMASLMALIAVVACVGNAWHERNATPIVGFAITVLGALLLGIGAGLLVLILTAPLSLPMRLGVVAVGAIAWKLRGLTRKTAPLAPTSSTRTQASDGANFPATPVSHSGWLLPQGGTVLDRLLPMLLIGALAFVLLRPTSRDNLLSGATAQPPILSAPSASAPSSTS